MEVTYEVYWTCVHSWEFFNSFAEYEKQHLLKHNIKEDVHGEN